MIGEKFGFWSVIERVENDRFCNKQFLCRCDCGNEKIIGVGNLKAGKSKSCGCNSASMTRERLTTHGKHDTDEYRIYHGIKTRCYNKNCYSYKVYGAIGITMSDRWLESFENFLEDMGERPSKKHSIDRRNNDEGYSAENCRWATPVQQANNTKRNHRIEINGNEKTLAEWTRIYGIRRSSVYKRTKKGMSIVEAITKPINKEMSRRSLVQYQT